MNIRLATVEDVETLFEIRCSVVENHMSREELAEMGITPEAVREMVLSGDYVVPVVEVDGRGVGFAMGEVPEGFVFAVFVRPAHEGQGVGRALLRVVEEEFARRGVSEAWLATGAEESLRARGFYRHQGWTDAGVLEDGQMRMTKRLG
jgi:GNAT superfamily N-acetyltransferase